MTVMKELERIGVVSDQRGSPTWAYDRSQAILMLINLNTEKLPGGHLSQDCCPRHGVTDGMKLAVTFILNK